MENPVIRHSFPIFAFANSKNAERKFRDQPRFTSTLSRAEHVKSRVKRSRQRLKPFFHADTKRLTHLRASLYDRANCPQNFVAKFRRKTPLVVLRENSRKEREREIERERERERLCKFAKNRYETVTVPVKSKHSPRHRAE